MFITQFIEGFANGKPLSFRPESVLRCIEHPERPEKLTDVQLLGREGDVTIRASLAELRDALASYGVRLVRIPPLNSWPAWHVNPAAVVCVDTDDLQAPADVRRRLRFANGTTHVTSASMQEVLNLLASVGA